jgi:hypothetical protein
VAIDIHKFLINNTLSKKDIHVEGMVHSGYNSKVNLKLQQILFDHGGTNISPAIAEQELIALTNQIRIWIINHPGVNLNNIILQ